MGFCGDATTSRSQTITKQNIILRPSPFVVRSFAVAVFFALRKFTVRQKSQNHLRVLCIPERGFEIFQICLFQRQALTLLYNTR